MTDWKPPTPITPEDIQRAKNAQRPPTGWSPSDRTERRINDIDRVLGEAEAGTYEIALATKNEPVMLDILTRYFQRRRGAP